MTNLKEDYKDYIPSTEHKRYRKQENEDGTISLIDVTNYQVEGSIFGAGDINATNKRVNAITPMSWQNVSISPVDIHQHTSTDDFVFKLVLTSSKLNGLKCTPKDMAFITITTTEYTDMFKVETRLNQIEMYFIEKPQSNITLDIALMRVA